MELREPVIFLVTIVTKCSSLGSANIFKRSSNMNRKKIALLLVIGLALSLGSAFASGASESQTTIFGQTTVPDQLITLDVSPTNEIRSFYSAGGVNGSDIDKPLNTLPTAVKDSIDEFTADNLDSVSDMVKAALRQSLTQSDAERVVMQLGRYKWTLTLGDL